MGRTNVVTAAISLLLLPWAGCGSGDSGSSSGDRAVSGTQIVAAPTSGQAPLGVVFEARLLDGAVGIAWDFGDGSAVAAGEKSFHVYETPGRFIVTLNVTYATGGLVEKKSAIVVEDNNPPCAVAIADPAGGPAPLTVNFDARESFDEDGVIAVASWDFGDGGEPAVGFSVAHTFQDAGTYTVVLTCIDASGEAGTATVAIVVSEAELICPNAIGPLSAGIVADAGINECSGLAWSRTQPVLWLHNDSGDSARFFGIAEDGELLAIVSLGGASARDWEDMAMGPCPGGGYAIHIADIGDNARARTSVWVHRVPEPMIDLDGIPASVTMTDYDSFQFVYPDGPHDAETLLVDPATGDVYIVSKESDGRSRVFFAACPTDGATITLVEVASLQFGTSSLPGSMLATGGDVAPDGRKILIRTYSRAFMFLRPAGGSLADAFGEVPCAVPSPSEAQGESIAFTGDGLGFHTLSEGLNQTVWRVDLSFAP